MVLQDKNRLGMLALGVQGNVPGTSLQPQLQDGVHLRWHFGPGDEFPQGGYYLLRRVSNEGSATFCLSQAMTRTALGSLVGTFDDATLSGTTLFRSGSGVFAQISSDRFLRLVDVESPDETFELDLANRTLLALTHTPARRVDYKIALGSPPSGTGGAGTPAGGGPGSGSSYVVYVLTFPMPPGTQVTQFAALASQRLDPRDRVKSDSAIANMGTQAVTTGTDCVLHSMYSRASITLNERSRVNGLVKTGGTLTRLAGATVGGPVTEHAAFDPPVTFRREVVFPPGPGADVLLEPDQQATIPPGRYRTIRVKSRAKLFLSTGAYFIETLEVLEPQATLVLDETNGPVHLYVLTPFAFRGVIQSNKPHPELLIGIINPGTVRLESPFKGTIIAPNSDLVIGSVPGNVHSGAFFAKTIEIQPDVQLVRRSSPGLTANPPIPITPGSCKISAWSGEHRLEERVLTGAGLVTGTFRADHIDRLEITASDGGGRLVDLCIWSLAAGVTTGWQAITGFTAPMALPVRHTNYPASGGLATDRVASEAIALARIQYGPPSAFAGLRFQELHDDYLVPLVAAGAGGMHSVVTTPVGEADPPDGQPPPQLGALASLEILSTTSLNPAVAQMLGLYFRDGTAASGTLYDYMIVADVANQFAGSIANLLTYLGSSSSLGASFAHFWVNYRVGRASTFPLAAPAGVTGYVMPGAAIEAPDGSIVNSAAVAGFLWNLPEGTSENLLSYAPVAYHFWRASAGSTSPPSPIPPAAHSVVNVDPQVVSLDLLSRIPAPSAPEWPPFALQYLDTGLSEGWYSYRVNGVDVFGRHSVLSSPAVWKQWRPAPDPLPWYYDPALPNDVVHPHALGALDKLAPPIPPGIEAVALDPADPLVVKDARYEAWRATLSPSEQVSLVGLRVRWNWSYSQISQAPDTAEFRIYHQPGALNAPSGRITGVSPVFTDQSRVTTDITDAFVADALAGGTLRVGRASYTIVGNQAGSPLVVTVSNLRIDAPAAPTVNSGCVLSIPRGSSSYVDYQDPRSWAARIHVVSYASAVEEAVVGAPAAGGVLIEGSGATAAGTTLTLPAGTSLTAVLKHKTHVSLAADTARANKIYRIVDVVAASRQLVLDGGPSLSGGSSAFAIGLYVRRYDVFLPAAGDPNRQGARLDVSQSAPMAYANVGVTAADSRAHVPDDPTRAGSPLGNRPGNESAVGGPVLIHRVHRGRPSAPVVPPDDEVVFATRADYRAESFYTFRWVPAARLRTVILRALDESVFKTDFLIRRTRSALSAADPTHAPFFPPDWEGSRRDAAAAALNAITSLGSYAGLGADARLLLARLPGNEARVGAGLSQYDFAIRRTRAALSQADNEYFPPDWAVELRRTTAANELNAIASPNDYLALRNDSLRVLAGLPGNERAFSQVSVQALDPDDPANANRVGPDNPETFGVDPNLRAYLATLDGRSRNRYFFRSQYVDAVQNRGALSLSSPPVTLRDVVPPRAPSFTRVLAGIADPNGDGNGRITLRWSSNREPDLAAYRLYRTDDPDAVRDVRLMTLVQTVSVAPADPRPGEVVFVDSELRGGVTYFYRLTAVDESGNASAASRPLSARVFDTRPPVPPTVSVTWLADEEDSRVSVSWTSEFEVSIQHKAPDAPWVTVIPFQAPGAVTVIDESSDPIVSYEYRALARSRVGALALGTAIALPALLPPPPVGPGS